MGFADTGASRLRNNRKLRGSRSRMNDEHLKVGKYYEDNSTKQKAINRNKISEDKRDKFKLKLKNRKKLNRRKTIISLITIAILIASLFLIFI